MGYIYKYIERERERETDRERQTDTHRQNISNEKNKASSQRKHASPATATNKPEEKNTRCFNRYKDQMGCDERETHRERQTDSQPERELASWPGKSNTSTRNLLCLTPRKKTRGASTGIKTK